MAEGFDREAFLAKAADVAIANPQDVKQLTETEEIGEPEFISRVTPTEGFLRGAQQSASLGFSDEASPVIQKAIAKGDELIGRVTGDEDRVSFARRVLDTPAKQFVEEERETLAEAKEAQPSAFLKGELAGVVPLLAIPGGAPIRTATLIGGIQAAGLSEAEGKGLVEDIAKGLATGAIFGTAAKGITIVAPAITKLSNRLAQKSLGFTKGLIKKVPGGLPKVEQSVEELFKRGVLKGGFAKIAESVDELRRASGEVIGAVLKKADDAGIQVFKQNELVDKLRTAVIDPSTGLTVDGMMQLPAFKPLANQFNRIIATIKNQQFNNGSFQAAQNLKGVLHVLGWKEGSEIAGKELARKAYLVVRDSIDDAVEKVSVEISDPKLAKEFFDAKTAYGAAKTAMRAIEEKASQAGNRIISLTDIILASGQVAAGKPGTGVATILGKKALESGAGTSLSSRALRRGAQAVRPVGSLVEKVGVIPVAGAASQQATESLVQRAQAR